MLKQYVKGIGCKLSHGGKVIDRIFLVENLSKTILGNVNVHKIIAYRNRRIKRFCQLLICKTLNC